MMEAISSLLDTIGNAEAGFMAALQHVLGPVGRFLAGIFTYFGQETVMVAVIAILFFWLNKEAGVYAGTNLMVGNTLNFTVKNLFLRKRPYFDHAEVKCLQAVEAKADPFDIAVQGYSFPSAHATGVAALYGSVALFFKKNWLTAVSVAIMLLVGVSRFALGVHYPSDVLVGYLVGFLAIGLVALLRIFIQKDWILFAVLTVLVIPGWFFASSDDFYTACGLQVGFFAAVLFERKFVRFEKPKNALIGILRVVLSFGIYLGLNALLKLPFPKEMREAGDLLAHIIRAARYLIVVFVAMGIYPMAFPFFDRLFSKKKER